MKFRKLVEAKCYTTGRVESNGHSLCRPTFIAWDTTRPKHREFWSPGTRAGSRFLSRRLPVSAIIRIVEHLLNLLWMLVASVLALLAVRGHRRGTLRCSLAVALGCTALIALVLFPALSMTDDLQRAKLDTETSSRHLGDTLLLGSPDDSLGTPAEVVPSLMLLLMHARLVSAGSTVRPQESLRLTDRPGIRPESARPPPVPFIA